MKYPVKIPFLLHGEHEFLTHLTLKRPEVTISDSELDCRFAKFLSNSQTAAQVQKIKLLQKALSRPDYTLPGLKVLTGKQII